MSAHSKDIPLSPSEIVGGPSGLEAFLERNQKAIAVLVVLLVIGAIAGVIYRGIAKSNQEAAGAALSKATDLASYQAVASANPGTQAGGSAMILLADSQWEAAKQDEAIGTLRKFIADFPGHPAIPSAKANLGAKLLAQGKSGDATTVFNELLADPAARFIAPFALIGLGDISRAAGDLDKAAANYNKVLNEFPGSEFGDNASRRLAILKTRPPVEIDAPPAPANGAAPAAPADDVPAVNFPGLDAAPTPATPPVEDPAPIKP
jgi:predicted negative regulator of RcsB-dependent stress response